MVGLQAVIRKEIMVAEVGIAAQGVAEVGIAA
jgi:hypothetical protein